MLAAHVVLNLAASPLTLLNTSIHPLARCLDSSPGAFYFSAASAKANASKWVINLEGGGECVDKASCQQRAGTALGSSAHMPKHHAMAGIQSTTPAHNEWATWNMIFVRCRRDAASPSAL